MTPPSLETPQGPQKKIIYDFLSSITDEVEKSETRMENGAEITVKTKVQDKIPVKILIYKPTRKQREEAELEYSKYLYFCMDQGLYTKNQIAKKYNDFGGDLSKQDADYYVKLQTELAIKIGEIQHYNSKDISTLTEEEKDAGAKLYAELSILKHSTIDFETQRSAIFDHSADQKAFYRILNWFTVFLTHKEINGKVEPMFKGATFEEKLDEYERLGEEKDELFFNVRNKLSAIIAYWFSASPQTREDFKPIEEELGI